MSQEVDLLKTQVNLLAQRVVHYPASTYTTEVNVLNTTTGMLTTIPANQIDLLQEYELILRDKPKSSCKVCYGSGFQGFNAINQSYAICPKCSKKMIDYRSATQRTITQFKKRIAELEAA